MASTLPKYGRAPAAVPWPSQGRRVEPHLVQDLAGLLLVPRVVDPALPCGEGGEGVEHEPGRKARAWWPAMRLSRPNRATNQGCRRPPAGAPGRGCRGARARRGRPRATAGTGEVARVRCARRHGRGMAAEAVAPPSSPAPAGSPPGSRLHPTPSRQAATRRSRATTERHRPRSASGAGRSCTRCAEPGRVVGEPHRRRGLILGHTGSEGTAGPVSRPRIWKMSAKSRRDLDAHGTTLGLRRPTS